MQTMFDDHVVHVLRMDGGSPVAMPIHLYRGDYLILGKASVRFAHRAWTSTMSLRDRLKGLDQGNGLYERFGVTANPFPASNQMIGHPHHVLEADAEAEDCVIEFFRDDTSQVVVVEGTQGVGKTNFLNHFASEVRDALQDREGYYVVRYVADPEGAFDGTTGFLFEELGTEHLSRLVAELKRDKQPIEAARSHDMRNALRALVRANGEYTKRLMMEWLLGLRVLKAHRLALGVQFRLDTGESKTGALRDLAQVSGEAGVLKGGPGMAVYTRPPRLFMRRAVIKRQQRAAVSFHRRCFALPLDRVRSSTARRNG